MARKIIRIAVTYIAYPVAMARYIHEALIYRDDVRVWCAGPFTGRAIPWGGGMNLPEKYLLKPDHPMPLTNPPLISYPMLEKNKPWEPDLWLEINAGMKTIGKPTSAPLALVLTDPHVLGAHYAECRPRADYVFNMQTPYMQQGDKWLPYGYSRRWHTPTEIPFEDREYDAALIGLQYPQRTQLVNRLRAEGLNVFYDLGPSYDDAKEIYHNTKVGLNWSSLQDTTARCFELMAFGLPAVMNRVPDLTRMFRDGKEFIGFDDLEEAVSAVKGLVADPAKAQWLAMSGLEAIQKHSWDARVAQILKETGLL